MQALSSWQRRRSCSSADARRSRRCRRRRRRCSSASSAATSATSTASKYRKPPAPRTRGTPDVTTGFAAGAAAASLKPAPINSNHPMADHDKKSRPHPLGAICLRTPARLVTWTPVVMGTPVVSVMVAVVSAGAGMGVLAGIAATRFATIGFAVAGAARPAFAAAALGGIQRQGEGGREGQDKRPARQGGGAAEGGERVHCGVWVCGWVKRPRDGADLNFDARVRGLFILTGHRARSKSRS